MDRRQFFAAATATVSLTRRSFADAARPAITRPPDYGTTDAEVVVGRTPKQDGYRLPAEWEPHESTVVAWPPAQNWKRSGIAMREVHRQWASVANSLCDFEKVRCVVTPADRRVAEKRLCGEVELIEFPVNDGWARDTGPIVLRDNAGRRTVAGVTFNGWGGKFPPFADDALLKSRLAGHFKLPFRPVDLVVEGGAISVDGEGTLLTTEQCLLHRTRNGHMGKAAVEKSLNETFGTSQVIWLGKGLVPDPVTDGHVDGLAAFIEPGVVLVHTTSDRNDPNFAICRDAIRRLKETRDARSRRLEVVELPLTAALSYMNFSIANGCVLVPKTGRPAEDDRPLGILRELFPERRVVGIEANVLHAGGGGIHCVTQQIPAI